MDLKPFHLLKQLFRPRRTRAGAGTTASPGRGDLSKRLSDNIASLKDLLGSPSDLYVHDLKTGGRPPRNIAVVYLRSMTDLAVLRESVLKPLVAWAGERSAGKGAQESLDEIRLSLPSSRGILRESLLKSVVDGLLEGRAAVLVDGCASALTVGLTVKTARGFDKPTSEITVQGPQIGFTESIEDNLSLVRTRIRSPRLAVERMVLGRKSRTEIRMLYLRGVAPVEIVEEVRRCLQSIDTDVILDPGMIRDLIRERPFSPFIVERMTERPDSVAAEINIGRVAVMVDGSPFVMLQPSQFFALFEAAEDYYMNSWSSSVLRLSRMLAYVLSTLATPIYVAVVTFHHELIPLPLLLNIAVTQEGVPLPLAVTAFLTEIILDVVREAGVRLPQQFGPAVSIVGALVLGQAAIQAGFVPPGLIIVVMFATIASFAIPRSENAIAYRLVRLPLLLIASILGFPGLMMGLLATTFHLTSLKSLGVPYFSLFTPGNVRRLARKVIVATPSLQAKTRPLGRLDTVRQGPLPKPKDPKAPEEEEMS